MKTRSRIRYAVGLKKEVSLLADRVQDLCDNRHGGTVLISAPRGRGKTILWQAALEEVKRHCCPPLVVSVDLDDAPQTYADLLALVQQPGFLPAKVTAAATMLVKALGDAAVQFPIPWLSKFIVKFLGTLPEIAEKLSKSRLEEEKNSGDFGFGLLTDLARTAGQSSPLMLIIENVESVSTISVDMAIEGIVELIRQNLPII